MGGMMTSSPMKVFATTIYSNSINRVEVEYKKGLNYYHDKQYRLAMKWFETAAEQGYAPAEFSVGNGYFYGQGVSINY